MGQLYYGNSAEPIMIPDQQLAYLKVVATVKLRRNESFTLNWRHVDDTPGSRTTIWLQPSIPLRFVFDEHETSKLDGAQLRDLAAQANSSAGLTLDLAADLQADLDNLSSLESEHAVV
jgi:hypothetical protein